MSIEIRCFHGTTQERAEAILSTGFFESSSTGLWLGTGIYFFENGLGHAASWARTIAQTEGTQPAILEARLKIRNLVDLSDRNHWDAVRKLHDKMAALSLLPVQTGPEILFAEESKYRTESWNHFTDHFVMNMYLEVINGNLEKAGGKLDGVRCPFVGGRQIYENSWYFHRSCSMISLKNSSAIYDLWLENF